MALNWEWAYQAGEVYHNGKAYPFYKGNAFMICLNEYKDKETGDDMYNMQWFLVDKDHAKRALGLAKNGDDKYSNIFEGKIDKIVIYKETCDNWKDIIDLFTKAFDNNIVIEIRNKKD